MRLLHMNGICCPIVKCNKWALNTVTCYGLFTLADPDSDPYSDSDSCTMQKFHIGSDSDSDHLTEMYVVGTEICP